MAVALKGFETFAGTNTPVVGATVDAIASSDTHPNGGATVASTTTNSNGMWAFAALADGTYDIRILYNSRYRWRKGNEAFSNSISGANFATQTANRLFAGPTSGGAATPTFRAMVAADVPSAILDAPNFVNQTANRLLSGPASGGAAAPTFRAMVLADLPLLSLIPACLVYNSAAQSIPNGAVTQVVYDTAVYNVGSEFNLSSDVWTASRTGLYSIAFGHLWDATIATTKRIQGYIAVNSVQNFIGYDLYTSNASVNWGMTGARIMKLTTGDIVSINAFQGDTTSRSIVAGQAANWFAAAFVGGT